MSYIETLRQMRSEGRAILATNFYNVETLYGVLRAAKETESVVILQTSPSTLDYLNIPTAHALARSASDHFGVETFLHLDHATDLYLVKACIDAGWDSVMIDASESDLATNIEKTKRALEMAAARNVSVEAELGYIPKLGQADLDDEGLTRPEEAIAFVKETGVHTLAVSIGTSHGFYKKAPRIDMARLTRIAEGVTSPLVLHGGSGVPADTLQEAIRRGIVKINFATDIKNAFTRSVKSTLTNSDEIDLRKTFSPGIDAVCQLVKNQLLICQMKGDKHV
jgi:tagatose 1,6-diphosphate aldolase GatY/KbaY